MTILQHLIKTVTIEESDHNLDLQEWSVDQNSVRVEFDQRVVLYDYVYEDVNYREIVFDSLEFTVHCEAIYDIESSDVTLGQTSVIESNKIAYRRFNDVTAESHDHYDERNLLDYLLIRLDEPSVMNSINLAIPRLLVTFIDL